MKRLFLLILFICSSTQSSIYISKIINNTNQNLIIEYSVPMNIKCYYPENCNSYTNNGIALNSKGIFLKNGPNNNWILELYEGSNVGLVDAYIPRIMDNPDYDNVITLKSGPKNGHHPDLPFALIRMNYGYLEKINPNFINHSSPKKTTRIIDEQLQDESKYILEIKQVSKELYFWNKTLGNKPILNNNAFELIFTKE